MPLSLLHRLPLAIGGRFGLRRIDLSPAANFDLSPERPLPDPREVDLSPERPLLSPAANFDLSPERPLPDPREVDLSPERPLCYGIA